MKKLLNKLTFASFLFGVALLTSCSGDSPEITKPDVVVVNPNGDTHKTIKGFYLLNQGKMGDNNASLDYYDSATGTYYRNIFPTLNPSVAHELGDVGNDMKIYKGKVYIVLNGSGKVIVINEKTGIQETEFDIEKCRYITFHENNAYVTSFSNLANDEDTKSGAVVKIDLQSMSIVAKKLAVGRDPEEMAVRDNKLYVTNSGGTTSTSDYKFDYDNRISVIDLDNFEITDWIEVTINPTKILLDGLGNIYVASNGNYINISPAINIVNHTDKVVKQLDVAVESMTLTDSYVAVCANAWSNLSQSFTASFTQIDIQTQKIATTSFLDESVRKEIRYPYGIAYNPETKDIFIMDSATDFTSPGALYCVNKNGERKWAVNTGVSPAKIVFCTEEMESLDLLK